MDRETISKLVEVIGKVEEVKNDANGDCMGEVIRVRVSIDVTKPLMKILEIKKEDMYEEEGTPVKLSKHLKNQSNRVERDLEA